MQAPNPTPPAIEVFFSYSHKDEALRDQLANHLSNLQRQGVIRKWHDRQIGAGKEWAGEIDSHLNSAHVILLLISSDFLASDYCYDIEMKRAIERHEAGDARVIPIILRSVDWKGTPFSKLQGFPKDGKPVTSWLNQDEAFLNIAKGLRSTVEEIIQLETQKASSGKKETGHIADTASNRSDQASNPQPQGVTMSQDNYGTSTGHQVLVQGGAAYVGGEIHVIQGGFYQPNWKVNTVNQAQGDINITDTGDRAEKTKDSTAALGNTDTQL